MRWFGVVVWIAAVACVVTPSTSTPAVAATFGADLSQPANNPITCVDGWPNQIPLAIELGAPPFYNSGSSSCLWTGSSAAQTLQAPSSGTVSAVRVKVGADTGAMRVVVLRTLYHNTFVIGHPEVACCIIQQYGPTFTPAANTITTVPTNLAMDEQTTPPEGDTEVVHFDLLGLEVLEPNVPVPAYTATNGAAEANIPDFAWFPAPGQSGVQAPSANVVPYTGDFSGYQVLMSAEMAGVAPALTPGPVPTPGPLPTALQTLLPKLTFPKLTLPVRNGTVSLPLQCAAADCVGNVLLENLEQQGATIAKTNTSKKKRKKITYGTGSVNVKAGVTGSVKVKLTAAGRKTAKAHRKLVVWANFTLGSTKLSKRITLTG